MQPTRVMIAALPNLERVAVLELLGDAVELVATPDSAEAIITGRVNCDTLAAEWLDVLESHPRITLVGLSSGELRACVVRLEPQTELFGNVTGAALIAIVRAARRRAVRS